MAVPLSSVGVNAYMQAAKMALSPDNAQGGAAATPGGSFGDMLSGILNDAQTTGRAAEQKAASGIQGKGDLVDVVTAISSAEMSLETVVAIRDKVIAAYQDIMRMPI